MNGVNGQTLYFGWESRTKGKKMIVEGGGERVQLRVVPGENGEEDTVYVKKLPKGTPSTPSEKNRKKSSVKFSGRAWNA